MPRSSPSSSLPLVVLPEPGKPHTMISLGPLLRVAIVPTDRIRYSPRMSLALEQGCTHVPAQARAMATWAQVRRYALALPDVVEETSFGNAAWKVNKKLFVWERPLRKSDIAALGDAAPPGAILGMRTADLEMKEALLRSDPHALFTTPHFDGYPAVLVQLDKISANSLKRLIVEAWIGRAPERSVREYLASRKRSKSM
jgi:hypothetical protein